VWSVKQSHKTSAENNSVNKSGKIMPTKPKLILATHNDHKLQEFISITESMLGQRIADGVISSSKELGVSDVIEDGTSFEENSYIKAAHVFRETGVPAIADDSGMIVKVLGKAPGIFSARWAGSHGDDLANVKLLLAQLGDVKQEDRLAKFVCAMTLVCGSGGGLRGAGAGRACDDVPSAADAGGAGRALRGASFCEVGQMYGALAFAPRGNNGFGYDPIFIPDEQPACGSETLKKTLAELTSEQKNTISHRMKATQKMLPYIKEFI
jgi:XTP/dITP diphosphohydrolase